MLRAVFSKLNARALLKNECSRVIAVSKANSHGRAAGEEVYVAGPISNETDEEFDARYVDYFNRKDIDNWEIRQAMNDLIASDLVPEPKIIIAAMHAARRLNDYPVAIRFIEAIKYKSRGSKDIFPYIMQEIKPTMDELGISTLEEMGYDQPELYLLPVAQAEPLKL